MPTQCANPKRCCTRLNIDRLRCPCLNGSSCVMQGTLRACSTGFNALVTQHVQHGMTDPATVHNEIVAQFQDV